MKDLSIIVDMFEVSNGPPTWAIELPDGGYIYLSKEVNKILDNWSRRRKKLLKERTKRKVL